MSKSGPKFKRYDDREVIIASPDFDYPFVDEDVERWKYELEFDTIDEGLHVMNVDLNGFTYDIYCVYEFESDSYTIISVTQRDKLFS